MHVWGHKLKNEQHFPCLDSRRNTRCNYSFLCFAFGSPHCQCAGFDQPKHSIDRVQCCTGVLSNLHAVACMPADACMLADAFVLADACMCRITIMYAHMSLVENGQVIFMSPNEIRAELFRMRLCECLVKALHRIMIFYSQPRQLP